MHPAESETVTKKQILLITLLAIVLISILTVWAMLTPSGWVGKLRAIAYSVCQQNPDHTLMIGYRLLPLCARCTGMFLGCLIGLIGFQTLTNGGGYPARKFRWILALFLLFFAVDGINSAVFTFFDGRALYLPNNILRLTSGLAMGMVLAAILVPLWRQILLHETADDSGLHSWRQFLPIFFAEGLTAVAVLFAPVWFYFPVAVLSTLSVPILVTMVYTLLWILAFNKEANIRNRIERFSYIVLGCLAAFVQIGALDLLRFAVTGTWAGSQF
jgi:uncharacterized membrane protein